MSNRMHVAPLAILGNHALLWRIFVALALLLCVLCGASIALAGPREQAARMHDRLAGVPADEATLNAMAATLPGNPTAAANIAMSNPNFYAVTLKNFSAPWTNRDQNAFVPLNDYMALVMGMVRDDVPFNQILTANLLYTGPASVTPAPSPTSNAHFEALEARMRDSTFDQSQLVQTTQTAVYGTPAAATAGAITTRAAAEAFFIAGTNRAMFRFTLMNHMCMDMEQVHDTSIAPDRIRQDVSRSPGGDSRVFLNNCIGCHAGMDPLAQAFAYYDFDETSQRLVYDSSAVNSKYFNNDATFPDGFVTPDDSWHNHWRQGQNALLGWNAALPGQGNGAKSLGEELAGTQAFAQCQVKKVFKAVCLRDPVDANDRNQIDAMTNTFRNAYNLKQVFAESAGYCMGN
ncbi:MAG TPA: hypothetical protein VFL84_10030 [Gammaproteobacteria bacterium]|nr:hypothetical protein [Gammaproteobacteria bacterium]